MNQNSIDSDAWLMSDDHKMYDQNEKQGPYLVGAPVYAGLGYEGILPLVPDTKIPALSGYHGREGKVSTPKGYTSAKAMKAFADKNIAWRLPKGFLGIDVDHGYDGKTGADTLAALEEKLGKLPATYSSTARGEDTPSRIRFFKVPVGAGELRPMIGKDIDSIQYHLRYACVWPSVHPKTGSMYRWYDKSDTPMVSPPNPGDFADLPASWVEYLSKPQIEHTAGAGLDVEDFVAQAIYESDPGAGRHVLDAFNPNEGSRHDSMMVAAGWASRLAAEGKISAGPIFRVLEEAWARATGDTREREFHDILKEVVEDAPEIVDPEDPDGPRFAADVPGEIKLKAREILKGREAVRQANWYEARQRADEKVSVADLMAQLLDGDDEDVPTVATIQDHEKGWGLFYPETVNGMYGDSSVGKSVIVAELQARELANGGTVVHWEFDNNAPKTLLRRLINAGAKPEDIVARFHPLYDVMDRDALPKGVMEATTLVTLDAVNPGIVNFGMDTNQTGGVDTVLQECMKPFVRHGACGVFVDHVGHEHKERQAGTIRKSQAVQGALYEVTRLAELKPGTTGRTAMVLRKDNRGALGVEGRTVAVAEMTSKARSGGAPGGVDTVFVLPDPFNHETAGDFIMGPDTDPKVKVLLDLFEKHDTPRAGRPAIVAHLKAKGVDLKGDTTDIAKAVKLYKNGV